MVVSVAHRRCGKTVARINKAIRRAAVCTLHEPMYAYLAPYYVQAKDIAWSYLKHYSAPILAQKGPFAAKRNESELSIVMPHNGATVRLYGAENIERMRGKYFDGVIVDEAQDMHPTALTSVILPALADRIGWLDVSGTPKGWGNLLGQAYKAALADMDHAKADPSYVAEWWCHMLKASQTGVLEAGELERLMRLMPDNEYLQELECSFDAAITGAYYAKGIADASFDGRITSVPYDKSARVNTWWDLGISDSMTIWFVQQVGREIRVIDYYEAAGYGLDHYADVLDKRGYLYGKHWAPHDIAVRELGTGKSRLEAASSLGIEFGTAPNISVKDGIDAVRMVFNRVWIDAKKCAVGLDALKQYQEKYDKKRGVSLGPLHNWASHAADSFRIGVVAIEIEAIKKRVEERERIGMGGGAGGWMG